jgi:hypothetical protein
MHESSIRNLIIVGVVVFISAFCYVAYQFEQQALNQQIKFVESVPFRPGLRVRHRSDGRKGIVTDIHYFSGIKVSFPTGLGNDPYTEWWYKPYELEVD